MTNPTILVNYSKLKRAETNPGTRPMIGLVSENLWFVISCKVFLWGKKIRVKKYFSWRSTSFGLCQLIAWYIDGNNGSNYSVLCSASKYCMLKLKKENFKGYILCKFLFLFRKRGCLTFCTTKLWLWNSRKRVQRRALRGKGRQTQLSISSLCAWLITRLAQII